MPDPVEILRRVFGHPAFRGEQQAIVEHVAAGGDAIVLMPTGGRQVGLLPGSGTRPRTASVSSSRR